MNQKPIITLSDITFMRETRRVLHDINIDIYPGKITAIMGPSGCGKTTLLRLMGGQLLPTRGKVSVFGAELKKLSTRKLYALRRRMGMLFQNGALFTDMTVFENVAFPLREHTNLTADLIRDIVLMKLQAVGLRGAARLMPAQLSGGMSRRVALARAIVLDPEIILYDEPFTGQDPISKGVLVKLIKTVNHALHTTTVLVSHDVTETLQLADYVYIIAEGGVVGQGTPIELQRNGNALTDQFLQGMPDGAVPFHYTAKSYANDLALQELL